MVAIPITKAICCIALKLAKDGKHELQNQRASRGDFLQRPYYDWNGLSDGF